MNELLFGPWPLFATVKLYSWQVLAAVLVSAQFAILVGYMMFGNKGSSGAGEGGDFGGWNFGDSGDGGGCGD